MSVSKRSKGLDTLRACAISLVFMHHYMAFVSHQPTFGWLSVLGWVGVDLFFVLSGYLIGNQVFAGLARGEELYPGSFYARRALRTWPAFWVVLSAYFAFPALMGGSTPPPLWRFLTFTQNMNLTPGTAFSHAWSLCIEEQFYLVLPIVLLLGLKIGANRAYGWALMAGLLVFGVSCRIVLWQTYAAGGMDDFGDYHPHIYYATRCRFDEFLPGLAVAMLKNFHPGIWARVSKMGHALTITGLISTATMLYLLFHFYQMQDNEYGFAMTAFGYSLMASAFAVLVAAALCPGSWLYRFSVPGAYHVALWSYSIYLSHKAIFNIVGAYSREHHLSGAVTLLAGAVLSIACGAMLYRLVEWPFMALRDRLFPSLFRGTALGRAAEVNA